MAHEINTQKPSHSSESSLAVSASAAAAIASDFYRDDYLHGGDDSRQATAMSLEVQRVLRGAQFHLRKWKSNSKEIEGMMTKDIYSPPTITQSTNTIFGDNTYKILGLEWSNADNTLLYST